MSTTHEIEGVDVVELKELVAKSCRILGKLGMAHSGEGHVSYRLPGRDSMMIRGKGPDQVGVRYTRPEDVIEVDFAANAVGESPLGIRPPSESFLHLWIYKLRPEVQSVIHLHPRHALVLTACEKELLPIHGRAGQGARLAVDGVPTWPSAITIHDDDLGKAFAEFVGTKQAALMRGHGITVTGTSVQDASVRAVALNELLTITFEAYLIGAPKPLPAGDIEWIRREADPDRPRGKAGGEAGMLSDWRYYCDLTGEPFS
jgi:ribulose-5-phosphate 4-epimerase/fuculose-1-phosphate aldolase